MRLQLALNVSNLEESIAFYSNLFDAEPAKIKPGYANFAIENPPLKLVLFEAADGAAGGTINHLGVETETADEVTSAQERLAAAEAARYRINRNGHIGRQNLLPGVDRLA